MLRNSCAKIMNKLTLDNEPDPLFQKITHLNNMMRTVKEMDGVKDSAEIQHALAELKNWIDNLPQDNAALSLNELQKKHQDLLNASSAFNSRFFLMMACVVANAATMGSAFYFALASNLPMFRKKIAVAAAGLGLVEGTIHLYKAKRFFAQKREFARIEIDAILAQQPSLQVETKNSFADQAVDAVTKVSDCLNGFTLFGQQYSTQYKKDAERAEVVTGINLTRN